MPESPPSPAFVTSSPAMPYEATDSMPVMQILRHETREAHDRVERSVAIGDRLQTLDSYQDLLKRLYGLYAPLEKALKTHYAIDLPAIGMASRWKTPWLVQDLRHFAIEPHSLPVFEGAFPLFNRSALLGVLYVIEGSSLGGQLILRELQHRHQLTPDTGARFFTGYGDAISAQWRSFGAAVNSLVCAHDSRYTVDSARKMFHIFGEWMKADAA